MAKILCVISSADYQDKEYGDSKLALEKAGHEVITCSTAEEAHGRFGGTETSDVLLKDVNIHDYDAVLFIGGPGSHAFFNDDIAHRVASDFQIAGKLVAAICAAPSILANAGLLQGRKATCFPSQAENLKKNGATYTGEHVEIDGQFITGDGPESATAFGEKIASQL